MNWKVVWLKIKMYGGYVVLGVITIIAFVLLAREESRLGNLTKLLAEQSNSYREQINALQAAKEAEKLRHAKIEADYKTAIANIEQQRRDETAKLSDEQKKEIRDIITQTQDDPELLVRRIYAKFGIRIDRGTDEETNPTS